MQAYEFECTSCGGPNARAFKFCPWCGIRSVKGNVNGRRFTIESFRKLLQPIIDLNGSTWVANRIGVDESHVRYIMQKQKFTVSESVAERWLIKLGIESALRDGSLVVFGAIEQPLTQYFEE